MVVSAVESALESSHSMFLIAPSVNTRKPLALVEKESCAKLMCSAVHKNEAMLWLDVSLERSQQTN